MPLPGCVFRAIMPCAPWRKVGIAAGGWLACWHESSGESHLWRALFAEHAYTDYCVSRSAQDDYAKRRVNCGRYARASRRANYGAACQHRCDGLA